MKILVTAGATREPIDDVRYVSNVSSGRTGAWIVEEAVRRFHTVYLLSGVGSLMPAKWALDTGLVVHREFDSTANLLVNAEKLLEMSFDAIIATAAVADYTPVPRRGKIASSQDKLVVSMVPTPKVIDRLHQIAPEAILVAFKLESGLTREELLARAGSTMARAGARFVVANLLAGHGCENHGAILLDSNDKTEELPTRRGLAERLIQRLEEEVRK